MGTVAGVISFRLGGKPIHVAGDITVNIGTPVREALEAVTGVPGYKERAGIPRLELETFLDQSLTLEEIATFKDGPITVNLKNGKSYAFRNAFYAGEGNLQTEENKIACVFNAESAEEISG